MKKPIEKYKYVIVENCYTYIFTTVQSLFTFTFFSSSILMIEFPFYSTSTTIFNDASGAHT